LNVIDARAEQLLSRPDSPPETRQRNLTIIRAQTESITRIVRQLLDLARPALIIVSATKFNRTKKCETKKSAGAYFFVSHFFVRRLCWPKR
jgi:signal transduction histidine kinase